MKPASTMSHGEKHSIALQYLQPEYARLRADEAADQEGFVRLR